MSFRKDTKNEKSDGPRKGPGGRATIQRWAEEEESLPGPQKELSERKCYIMEAVVGSL